MLRTFGSISRRTEEYICPVGKLVLHKFNGEEIFHAGAVLEYIRINRVESGSVAAGRVCGLGHHIPILGVESHAAQICPGGGAGKPSGRKIGGDVVAGFPEVRFDEIPGFPCAGKALVILCRSVNLVAYDAFAVNLHKAEVGHCADELHLGAACLRVVSTELRSVNRSVTQELVASAYSLVIAAPALEASCTLSVKG